MKYAKYFSILLYFVCNQITFSQSSDFDNLITKYYAKDFFTFLKLSEYPALQLEDWQRLYINSLRMNLLNKPVESGKYIDELMVKDYIPFHDSLLMKLYEVKIQNAVNLCEYQLASGFCETVVNNYIKYLSEEDISNYKNAFAIFSAAADLPLQTVEIKNQTKIPVTIDLAGMINLAVRFNGKKEQFIFDTGANFSAIVKSLSVKLNLKTIGGKIQVGTATDKKLEAEIAYADSIDISGILCKNVLFLVLPDEALTFGSYYKINGIIGLPVIREFKEMRISSDGILIPSVPNSKPYNNFVINGFTPVIEVINGKDSLVFVFDTGAKKTVLFAPYYRKYKTEVEKNFELQDLELGGAGGTIKIKGFILDEVTLKIADSKVNIDDVRLFSKDIQERDYNIHGSIGQDFISKFSTMVINFESMYVEFIK